MKRFEIAFALSLLAFISAHTSAGILCFGWSMTGLFWCAIGIYRMFRDNQSPWD